MKLTLIRHTPTQYSEAGLFMGDMDIPATQEGLKKAQILGDLLKSVPFTYYVSSPLTRAFQTAKAIFPCKFINIDYNLCERSLGSWAGNSKKEIRKLYPQAFLSSGFIDPYYTPDNGEAFDHVVQRVTAFIEGLLLFPKDSNVVAITHNGIIRITRCLLEKRPLQEVFFEGEPYLTPRSYTYSGLGNWEQYSIIEIDEIPDQLIN